MTGKSYFNRVANRWDEMRKTFFSEQLRENALQVVNVRSGQQAADIGAGTGFITEALLEQGLRVIAVDQSVVMLDVLRAKFPGVADLECRPGEAEHLPIPDAAVDAVFANMYLHHVDNPSASVAEMVRILKPGGKLVVTDLDTHSHEFLKAEHHDRWMGFDRKDVAKWLGDAGLSDVRVICAGHNCCAASRDGGDVADISIFMATGANP